jgi:hypothetical protein
MASRFFARVAAIFRPHIQLSSQRARGIVDKQLKTIKKQVEFGFAGNSAKLRSLREMEA